MNTKVKVKIKSILFVILAILMFNCLYVLANKNNIKVNASTEINTSSGEKVEFTKVTDDDIVLSVEKVILSDSGSHTFYKDTENTIKFNDLPEGEKTKYVVEDNSYVMIDSTSKKQAIVVSFGAYVLKEENDDKYTIDTAKSDGSTNAEISSLTVLMYRSNKQGEFTNPVVRSYFVGAELRADFAYLIDDSDPTNEGYYKFVFNYMKQGVNSTAEVEFYILFRSSYTKTETINGTNYTSFPTFGWGSSAGMFEQSSSDMHFSLGQTGIGTNESYPTLTYDYAHYAVNYTHVSNEKISYYNVYFRPTESISGINGGTLVVEITGSRNETIEYPIANFNSSESKCNFVSLVFTEIGEYNFNFTYVYLGANKDNAPNINLNLSRKKLTIHGFELLYSKLNYTSSQLRHFVLAENERVQLIVPNAVKEDQISKYQNSDLMLTYSTKNSLVSRAGTLLSYSQDADITQTIIKDGTLDKDQVSNIEYIKTNQGSMWFKYNDSFDSLDSYYYFNAKEKINVDDDIKEDYTNRTSFNKVGYYLVVIKTNYSTQAFAFQYTTDTLTIDVKDSEKNIGAEQYTNKNVKISWVQPGRFEKSVKIFVSTVQNQNITNRNDFPQANEITDYQQDLEENVNYFELGNQVQTGNFAKYLIKLQSEGNSATYTTFTIDRQPITEVKAYVIKSFSSNGKLSYIFATDSSGYDIEIKNGITDSYATLSWADKASGATINASYSYTPFVANSNEIERFANSNQYVTTNYELGTTVEGFAINKATDRNNINYSNVVYNQGIYIFTISDQAGNSCKYAFIIDNTPAYVFVGEQGEESQAKAYTNGSLVFSKDVYIYSGKTKVFELNSTNSDVLDFINAFANNQQFDGYYSGEGSNINELRNLFNVYNSKTYLTISHQNPAIKAYSDFGIYDATTSSNVNSSNKFSYDESLLNGATSLIRKFYLLGINNLYSTRINDYIDSKVYLKIEINTDNSQAMVYYANDTINSNVSIENNSNLTRLYTGSDSQNNSGLKGAHASSKNNILFTIKFGEGLFELNSVKYSYYALNLNDLTQFNNNKCYFYTDATKTEIIYSRGATDNVLIRNLAGNGEFILNNCKDGLYVFTREYVGNEQDFASLTDQFRKNYYFIVDGNNIIDINNIGNEIKIRLLESKTSFNEFNQYGAETGRLIDYNIDYTVQLKTNRLPAVINVPTGKYYIENENKYSSKDYFAGRLNITLYYENTQSQINSVLPIVLFSSSTTSESLTNTIYGEYIFQINLKEYLSNSQYLSRFIVEDNNGSWLCLPGRYVLVITDNTEYRLGEESSVGAHKQVIAFDIVSHIAPTPTIETGHKDGETQQMGEAIIINNQIVTNNEYINIVLTEPEIDAVQAQIDNKYLVVTKNGEPYINYPYSYQSGKADLSKNSDFVTKQGNQTIVKLETFLRDAMGNILIENLNSMVEYLVTIRYELSTDNSNETYKNCYYYFDSNGNKISFYETKLTILIDRQAPSVNVDSLTQSEAELINYYNKETGANSLFNHHYFDLGKIYYTYNYTDYYNANKKLNSLYIFNVNANTKFNWQDVEEVEIREYSLKNSISLPITTKDTSIIKALDYSETELSNFYYGNFSKLVLGNYYEILEYDKAGNTTQYLIRYAENAPKLSLIVDYKDTIGSERSGDLTASNYNVFAVSKGTTSYLNNYYYYHVRLIKDNSEILSQNTHMSQENVASSIVENINKNGKGNYIIELTFIKFDENGNKSVTTEKNLLSLYSEADRAEILASELIAGNYIDFNKAVKTKDGVTYYATEIAITVDGKTDTYVCDPTQSYKYKLGENFVEYNRIAIIQETSYVITVKDVFNSTNTCRYNSKGNIFYSVEFENGNSGTIYNNISYGFAKSASLTFDNSLFKYFTIYITEDNKSPVTIGVNLNAEKIVDSKYIEVITENTSYKLKFNLPTEAQKLMIDVAFSTDEHFKFCMDISSSVVNLRDSITGESTNMNSYINTEFDSTGLTVSITTSGVKNLSWGDYSSNYFNFSYVLHKEKVDGSYENVTFDKAELSTVINTTDDLSGWYVLEIVVLDSSNNKIGNKLYVFEVKTSKNWLYSVRVNGKEISANSTFKFDELTSDIKPASLIGNLPTSDIPLYVITEDYEVVLEQNITKSEYPLTVNPNKLYSSFVVYKVSAYDIYFAVLKVKPNQSLISSASINDITVGTSELSPFTTKGDYSFNILRKTNSLDALEKKISLTLTVSYIINDENQSQVDAKKYSRDMTTEIKYSILGNGKYKFVVGDIAGNTHVFANGESEISATIMREVVLFINDKPSVNNAYYSEPVEMRIFLNTRYDSLVEIKATRNGSEYSFKSTNPYKFEDYGTYVVKATAKFNGIPLEKTLTFTILNPNEAKQAINFSPISAHTITKVLNQNNVEVTQEFKNLVNANSLEGSLLLTYDKVLENAKQLKISAGKFSFKICYLVEDKIYPNQEINFSFTLNNEVPQIDCSLKAGESTKNGFTISFNPGIIYEQVGDSFIYINDRLVATINESSNFGIQSVSTTFKEYGAGDYYVQLMSASGNPITSFKVEIKEPLNTWAIVIIVVVVLVVGTVITVIIVLRRKMRIR